MPLFAFPRAMEGGYDDERGMTLRDYFAAAALAGILGNMQVNMDAEDEKIAKSVYQLADAMLKERDR